MITRAFQIVSLLWIAASSAILIWVASKGGFASSSPEYKDFVAILLTALGVMIGLGAVFIAVLAIWTYKHAMELIADVAAKSAKETAIPVAEVTASKVAAETATAVATRIAMDAPRSDTSAAEAEQIVEAVTAENNG